MIAVTADEEVIPASELVTANKQIRELQCLLGKKTMEAEILKEAVEWLTDNGSAYRAHETRGAWILGLSHVQRQYGARKVMT